LRVWLVVVNALLLGVSLSLLAFTDQTDRYFAWTVSPPLTAAFLGAGYAASCVFQLLAARQQMWIHAWIAPIGALLFTGLTLLATLIHLDRFHVNSFIGQLWLVIYAIAPPVMVVLLVRQWRTLGVDPDRTRPLATWLRILLGVQALVLIPAGAGLFLAPQLSPQLWPWVLTPLTARAIGAWLIAVWRGHEPSRLGERPGPRVDRTRQFCDLRRAAAGRNRPLSSYSELAQPAGLAVCAVPGAPARIRGWWLIPAPSYRVAVTAAADALTDACLRCPRRNVGETPPPITLIIFGMVSGNGRTWPEFSRV